MSDALFISATGMHAQQMQVDTIANNLANLNTTGFKKSRVSFEPLMPEAMQLENAARATSYKGMGAAVSSLAPDFSPGEMKQTQRDLDVAINGVGFFEVQLPDGSRAYSRQGALRVDPQGYLATSTGLPLSASISIPSEAQSVIVNADGRVQVKYSTSDELTDVGTIELAQFVNDRGLKPMGENVYLATEESGDALIGRPGENGVGTLAQGYLESSNVQLVEELTSLMVAQRAYEANSKVLSAADEMLSLVNNLRR
jgi:flagellar basal-body rod protein FlgG